MHGEVEALGSGPPVVVVISPVECRCLLLAHDRAAAPAVVAVESHVVVAVQPLVRTRVLEPESLASSQKAVPLGYLNDPVVTGVSVAVGAVTAQLLLL
eukprot:CAMPEP_0206245796 /NCGR_PEP_ID=MMETSP0047_2-20121206/18896_1 /ASSEMBLY_ACC=CAM_ASM_000192 /TAXON_ID=195065 /ORGANISM="Chroomonas mesostigmatica_cf, Strain CCMP1168" /LENGTH=97 /DNA_ID=CAMNT_0053671135 /DNA_START=308 /DNA_END=601 /DNA_ORIENTATION=-